MGSGLAMTARLLEGLSASRNSLYPPPCMFVNRFICVFTTAFCVLADNRSAVRLHAAAPRILLLLHGSCSCTVDPAAETCTCWSNAVASWPTLVAEAAFIWAQRRSLGSCHLACLRVAAS